MLLIPRNKKYLPYLLIKARVLSVQKVYKIGRPREIRDFATKFVK